MEKKPIYKRWWFVTIAILFIVGYFGSQGDKQPSPSVAKTTPSLIAADVQKEEITATTSALQGTSSVPISPKVVQPKETPISKPVSPIMPPVAQTKVIPPPVAPVPTTQPVTQPTTQTDRASVLVVLKTNASTKWGDDYQMVKYEYDNQVSAYDWVVAQTKYPDIMTKAKQKWSNDFTMVKYEYNQQVTAYEWVVAQTQYPDIMTKAKQKWGTDYQMVEYEYNQQVEAFQSL